MRKGLKIGMLAVALLATTTAIISTGKVQAEEDTNNKVQVVIGQYNDGQNTCSGNTFYFEFTASTDEQSAATGNVFECKFGNPAQKNVQLALSGDLTATTGDATYTISGENVKLTNSLWTMTPSGLGTNTPITTGNLKVADANQIPVLFGKNEKMVGDASGNVVIQVTVPAGQPGGQYNGTLVLTF